MNKFKIVPFDKSLANKIRQERVDNFGIEVIEQVATGAGPCRLTLKPFNLGVDKRLLFLHSPFGKNNAFNQNGPVFIHSSEVEYLHARNAEAGCFICKIERVKIMF